MTDLATASTAGEIGAPTDNSMLTCQQQLDIGSVDVGYSTPFDGNNGVVYITAGQTCWKELMDGVEALNNFIVEQVKKLEEAGLDVEEWGLKADRLTTIMEEVKNYTSGDLLVTAWNWDVSGFAPGDSAGVCVHQQGGPQEKASTCWTFSMRSDGEFKDEPEAYLVMPSEITDVTRLSDFTNKQSEMTAGLFGSWFCLPVLQMRDRATTSCLRFLPKEESSTAEDPKIDIGPVTVMTYLTNRGEVAESFNENDTLVAEESAFEFFQLNLMGAKMGVSAAALAIVASVTLLSF